jgi:hypothetical protein
MRTPCTIRTASRSAYAVDRDARGLTLKRPPAVHAPVSDDVAPIPSESLRRDGEILRLLAEPQLAVGKHAAFIIQVADEPGTVTTRITTKAGRRAPRPGDRDCR